MNKGMHLMILGLLYSLRDHWSCLPSPLSQFSVLWCLVRRSIPLIYNSIFLKPGIEISSSSHCFNHQMSSYVICCHLVTFLVTSLATFNDTDNRHGVLWKLLDTADLNSLLTHLLITYSQSHYQFLEEPLEDKQ